MAINDRRNAILDEVLAFNRDRKPKRVRLKLQRMDEGPFPFFRGTDHLFARAWPELKPPNVGPTTLLCGDLHLENFGAYRSDDGDYLFDINDFDEALVAPVGLDLVRCTASILLAAKQWRLSPLQAAGMALAFLDHYRSALTTTPRAHLIDLAAPHSDRGAVWDLLGATALGSHLALLNHHTELTKGGTRRIIRAKGKRPAIGEKRAEQIRLAVEQYGKDTPTPGAYKVHDVTARIAGIGNIGLRRYLVLIEGDRSPDQNRLLDIKEARPSSRPRERRRADPVGRRTHPRFHACRRRPVRRADPDRIQGVPPRPETARSLAQALASQADRAGDVMRSLDCLWPMRGGPPAPSRPIHRVDTSVPPSQSVTKVTPRAVQPRSSRALVGPSRSFSIDLTSFSMANGLRM